MNRIRRRAWGRRASAPGIREPQATRLLSHRLHLASRPGRDGWAEQFIQDVAAAASVATGQNWPASTATMSRRRMVTAPRLLPCTVTLCTHCRHSPAGFWVSAISGQTVRRPWCLACCQGLDRDRCDVTPFDS